MPNVVTIMLKIYNFDVYALLDPSATLYFITPFVSNRLLIYVTNYYINLLRCLPPSMSLLLLKESIRVVPCPHYIKSCLVILLN